MTTLSYLVEAVRGDVDLPEDAAASGPVDLRSLAGQVTQLARIAHEAAVMLRPGPEVQVMSSPVLLWRVLTNVVDNAARAAGPAGRVELTVGMLAKPPPMALLQVQDNGPGFGHGPPGAAPLGLGVVTRLLESCSGSMEVEAPAGGGVLVRIVIPAEPILPAAPDRPPGNQVSR